MAKRVLVPLDGSSFSEEALAHAQSAAGPGGTLRLLNVVHSVPGVHPGEPAPPMALKGVHREVQQLVEDGRAYLEKVAGKLRAEGAQTEVEVSYGTPSADIVEQAARWPADLIVMSSHGRSGLDRWILGSVAERVWRMSPCPVMLVRCGTRPAVPALAGDPLEELRRTVGQQQAQLDELRRRVEQLQESDLEPCRPARRPFSPAPSDSD